MLIREVLDRALSDAPDSEALVTRSQRMSYADLDRRANQAAHAFLGRGLAAGDRVAVSLPNEADIVVAFHGLMRIGAVWVGINQSLAPPEKTFILADSGAALFLTNEDIAKQPTCPTATLEDWRREVDATDASRPDCDIDPLAAAAIGYTSGTTGRPKGAVHSQYNLLLPGAVLVATGRYGKQLRKGDCLPFTILNLMVVTTLMAAQAGGCVVVMDRLDPEGIADWIRQERITSWNGPPALLNRLATTDAVRAGDLASLDEVWAGGAACPRATRDRFRRKFGLTVTATYGLTEAPALVAIEQSSEAHITGSSGQVLPHLSVRIADRKGETLPYGETGEILVSPASVEQWQGPPYRLMLEYWRRPEATAEAIRAGELRTGDLGFVDAHGNLRVEERSSLVILRGGANVYPAEVERVLDSVDGVITSVVFGTPDEELGERVMAVVEIAATAQVAESDLEEYCRANLAPYKIPERFIFIDTMPRNAMGKVVRPDVAAFGKRVLGVRRRPKHWRPA